MIGARLVAGALAIALATAVAGCGPLASSPGGVGSAFATQALAVCVRALDLKAAQGPFPVSDFDPTRPDATMLPKVAEFLERTAATLETWLAEMEALGEPPSGATAWADLLEAIARHVHVSADQVAAARRGDAATFASDYEEGRRTQADLLRAAQAAGVADCANVGR